MYHNDKKLQHKPRIKKFNLANILVYCLTFVQFLGVNGDFDIISVLKTLNSHLLEEKLKVEGIFNARFPIRPICRKYVRVFVANGNLNI